MKLVFSQSKYNSDLKVSITVAAFSPTDLEEDKHRLFPGIIILDKVHQERYDEYGDRLTETSYTCIKAPVQEFMIIRRAIELFDKS